MGRPLDFTGADHLQLCTFAIIVDQCLCLQFFADSLALPSLPEGQLDLGGKYRVAKYFQWTSFSVTVSVSRAAQVVLACQITRDASLRCLYSSGSSPLSFQAPVSKLIYL